MEGDSELRARLEPSHPVEFDLIRPDDPQALGRGLSARRRSAGTAPEEDRQPLTMGCTFRDFMDSARRMWRVAGYFGLANFARFAWFGAYSEPCESSRLCHVKVPTSKRLDLSAIRKTAR
jgi:hypothetical protein